MKLNEIKDPVQEFLGKNGIKKYKINPDGTIDVNGSVKISTKQSKFPVKFGRVNGWFDCELCELTSLEGAPSHVNGFFSCEDNKFTSLHNVHKHIKEIKGGFYCLKNNIKDSVLGILLIKGVYGVYFDNKKVQKILNKYLEQGRAGVIGAQQELLDAGLDEYAKL